MAELMPIEYTPYNEEVKKDRYIHQLFCWIEKEQTHKVIEFFETYPQFVNKLQSVSCWSPPMYAVRYGNFELLKYFVEKGHQLDIPNIYNNTVVHAACYSNDPQMLLYVLNQLKRDPNPPNSEMSPLKHCIKFNHPKLLEILTHYGAYYIFDEVYNNLDRKEDDGATNPAHAHFVSLTTRKDIPSNMIVKDNQLKECPIKQVLRWVRVKNLMYIKKESESSKDGSANAQGLSNILNNRKHYQNILRLCVGSGKYLVNGPTNDAKDQQQMSIEK